MCIMMFSPHLARVASLETFMSEIRDYIHCVFDFMDLHFWALTFSVLRARAKGQLPFLLRGLPDPGIKLGL